VLLSVEEACRELGISRTTLYELRKRRRIPYVRVGRRVLFPRAELEEWIRRQASTTFRH